MRLLRQARDGSQRTTCIFFYLSDGHVNVILMKSIVRSKLQLHGIMSEIDWQSYFVFLADNMNTVLTQLATNLVFVLEYGLNAEKHIVKSSRNHKITS